MRTGDRQDMFCTALAQYCNRCDVDSSRPGASAIDHPRGLGYVPGPLRRRTLARETLIPGPNRNGVNMTKTEQGEAPVDFEQALAELEALVERMESGELSLEDSLKSFERGIALTRQCQQALTAAEQKVEILTGKDGEDGVEAFAADDSD